MGPQTSFNPFDPQFRANPFPYYRELVKRPPVRLRRAATTIVLVARYGDSCSVLDDPETFSSQPPEDHSFRKINLTGGAPMLLTSDPPVHTRLRRLVSRDFTPRRIAALEPRIHAITESLLDRVGSQPAFDGVADLADQLPVAVIAETFGVPADRYQQFKQWADTILASSAAARIPSPEAIAAVAALQAFCTQEIERRRRDPGADLISALVAGRESADAMTDKELLGFMLLLLLAGAVNSTNLVGNALLALCRHPQQMARLRREPSLASSAIEEILRYDPPLHGIVRMPTRPTTVGGVPVERGQPIAVLLAAANRDPARFADPDCLDITRSPNDHLAFGDGIHVCLGAALARVQAAIAIGAVLRRFPRLRLADPAGPLRYKGSVFLRGLESLPIATD